jgi:predicted O-methyltransferase YrrM
MLIWPPLLERFVLSIRYGFKVPGFDGMMNAEKCRFLWEMVNNYSGRKGIMIEIGAWQGCSTTWLGVAGRRNKFKRLIVIDLFTGTPSWEEAGINTHGAFLKRMDQNSLDAFVQPIIGDSKKVIRSLQLEDVVSIVHIDGDHEYSAVKEDINNYGILLDNGGMLIIDDYDSNHPDVVRAVNEALHSGHYKKYGQVKETPGKGYGSIALIKVKI